MIPLIYEELEKETIEAIAKNPKMVLATSADNRVTARMMSIVHNGLTIMFQTDIHFTKFEQMAANPNVALCTGNLKIEGKARITCHPCDNPYFIEHFQIRHEKAFKQYTHLKDEILIEVEPQKVTFWKYDEKHHPYRDYLDIVNHLAYREIYQTGA